MLFLGKAVSADQILDYGREVQRGNHLVPLRFQLTLARRRGELRLVLPRFPDF